MFVQYFGAIHAYKACFNVCVFTSKCKIKGSNSCLMQYFILFKLTDVEIYQTIYPVYAYTEI